MPVKKSTRTLNNILVLNVLTIETINDIMKKLRGEAEISTFMKGIWLMSRLEIASPNRARIVMEGRYADAIRLIRKDNPFPTTCGFICEHPCEARCRRNMVDDSVNIRGLKRVAADFAGEAAMFLWMQFVQRSVLGQRR